MPLCRYDGQRAGQALDGHLRTACTMEFAVCFEVRWRLEREFERRLAQRRDLPASNVRSAEGTSEQYESSRGPGIANRDQVEEPVVELRARGNVKCTAKEAAIGEDEHQMRSVRMCGTSGGGHLGVEATVCTERMHRRTQVGGTSRTPAPESGNDFGIEAESCGVHERDAVDGAHVDASMAPAIDEPRHRDEIVRRYTDGPREVIAGSGGEQRKRERAFCRHERTRRMTHGAVAAQHHKRPCACTMRLNSESRLVTRTACLVHRDHTNRFQCISGIAGTSSCVTAARRWIDQQMDGAHGAILTRLMRVRSDVRPFRWWHTLFEIALNVRMITSRFGNFVHIHRVYRS